MKEVKKPLYKRWWFIAIVAFFIIGTLGLIFESDEAKEKRLANEMAMEEERQAEIEKEEVERKEKELAKQEEKEKKEQEKREKELTEEKRKENEEVEEVEAEVVKTPLEQIEEKSYIMSVNLDDEGVVNAEIDQKSPLTVNFIIDKAVDVLEDMQIAFQDENVNGYYANVRTMMVDSKGNEMEESAFDLYYAREDFEALNYEKFYDMAYSQPYRIFNEASSYLIHPGIYKDLKDEYKNNFTHKHNKPNYVTE